jgi:NAD(P)-dependent dehydrogenase (short-subunit alcohol dehydrogenase family)
VIGIVLLGTLHATMACGRRWLKAASKGTVLSISATYAPVGSAYVVPSAVSKAGVEALTRSLAVEWGNRGIRMNAIAPGPIPTQGAFSRLTATPRTRSASVPRKSWRISPHFSDGSAYINGEVIRMDGNKAPESSATLTKTISETAQTARLSLKEVLECGTPSPNNPRVESDRNR